MRIIFEDDTEYTANSIEDPFMKGFNGNLFLRRSCYSCPFARDSREGDVTIGDFWGLGVLKDTKINTVQGVNFVKINNSQGEKLFRKIIDTQNVMIEEHMIHEAKLRNQTLTKPMKKPSNREKFFDMMDNEDFEHLIISLANKHSFSRKIRDYRDRAIKKIRRSFMRFIGVNK